jgi:inosine-uridine nucleoside N-ribohydrolase
MSINSPKQIIIDTDISIGVPFRDVDDALAITFALNSPELKIELITTTWGNSSLENVNKSIKTFVTKFTNNHKEKCFPTIASGADMPLSKIMLKENIDDTEIDAVEKIKALLENSNEKITIVTIGPLTNIALLLMKYPHLVDKIEKVMMMGGYLNGYEFNFAVDPEAVDQVFSFCNLLNIEVFGIEVCTKIVFTDNELNKLRSTKNSFSNYLVENIRGWLRLNKLFNIRNINKGFFPFDTLPFLALIDKKLINFHAIIDKRIVQQQAVKLSYFNILSKTKIDSESIINKSLIKWGESIKEAEALDLLCSRLI